MNKKDLIIVALATFCLTATLFMMIPTRSETPVGTYDPWVDVNEDGKINVLDSIVQGNHFFTSGDSTKNVTVKDDTFSWSSGTIVIPIHTAWWSPMIDSSDYTQLTLRVKTNGTGDDIWLHTFIEGSDIAEYVNESLQTDRWHIWHTVTYKIKFTSFQIEVNHTYGYPTDTVDLDIYMSSIPVVDFPEVQGTYVTNWPYTQSQPCYKEIHVFENYPLLIAPNSTVVLDLGTVWTAGYSRMSVYAKLANISSIAEYSTVDIRIEANETYSSGIARGAFGTSLIGWNHNNFDTEFGTSWPSDAMYIMKAPAYLLTLRASYTVHYPLQPSATCLLSLELYLRNE